MEITTRKAITSALEERFGGQFASVVPKLESLLDSQGGEYNNRTLRIDFNPKYGAGYTACIIHGSMVQSVDHLPIPKPYVAVLRRFNGAKFHAIDLFGMLEDDPIRGVVNHWISQIGSGSMNITDYPKVRSTLGSGRFLIEKTSATFTTHR